MLRVLQKIKMIRDGVIVRQNVRMSVALASDHAHAELLCSKVRACERQALVMYLTMQRI